MGPEYQQWRNRQDEEHLKLLALLFRIYGGFCFLGTCFFSIYIFFGLAVFASSSLPRSAHGQNDAAFMSTFFTVVGGIGMLLAATMGVFYFVSANWIQNRTNWTGVFVMSIIACLNTPIGTALGVFALVVINRDNVKALFGQQYSGNQGAKETGVQSEFQDRLKP